MLKIIVTVRAIIIHEGKLLMCQQKSDHTFHCLPGGKLEPGETLEQGLIREITEETGITPELGNLLYISQFIDAANHRIEFFYRVTNPADFANFDPTKATHAHEITSFVLGNATDPAYNLLPKFLRSRIADIATRGDQLPIETIIAG